jgi:colanic acid biosynthesis glycosyl transferase WcaI
MRALFVNQYFPPDASATAYLLGELTEDLAAHHEIWVVAGRPSYNPEGSTFTPQGPKVVRTWSTSFSRKAGIPGRALNYLTFVVTSFLGAMRVPPPDVVVAMTDPPFIGLIGLLTSELRRCPFVYVCHDIFPDVGISLGMVDNPAAVTLLRALNRLLRRSADRIVAIGRDMREKLVREGVPGRKVAFIPNWSGEPDGSGRDPGDVRRELGWDGKFVVLHAGNVGLAQHLTTAVDAAEELQDQEDFRLVFLGDGAARPSLERRVRERRLRNVEFMPYLPKPQAQEIVGAADAHLVSLAPGLFGCVVPSKIYGIMAAGKPFVAAVDPGSEIDRMVQEFGCGVRVDPADAGGLGRAIRELRGAEARRMGDRGREAFRESFRRSVVTASYRALLEDVASGR